MIAGIAITVLSYISSTGADIAADQTELLSLGFAGVAVTLTGAALFLRYSLAKFLRFWLLRQLYEGQAHVDELVASLRPSAGLGADGLVGDRNGGRGEDQLDAAGHAAPDLADGKAAHDPATQDG
jgi:hypothetical protein